MKNKIFIAVFIALIYSLNINAQELKNYNLYNQNPILYNPSFAINDALATAYVNSHLQWIGIHGSPRAYDFGASFNFFPNMGAAVSVSNSRQGLMNNLYANLKYGYQLNFEDEHYIKMGLSLGIANDRIITEDAQNVDMSDNNLSTSYYNKTVFSSGFGLAYQYKSFDAQIIMPQLFEYKTTNIYTIGVLGYNYKIDDTWNLKPSVMFRGAKSTPFQFEGNITVMRNKMLWGQLGYRSDNSFIFGLGVEISNYSIGYAYQANTAPISYGTSGTHEVQFIYKFGNKNVEKIIKKTNFYGNVTSELDNKPLNAKIIISENDIKIVEINSNEETGNYGVELMPEKSYTINVSADNYYPVNELITTGVDQLNFEKNFKLISKEAIVEGQITNLKNNNPIVAKIIIMEDNKIIAETNSDESGNYSVKLPSGKKYNVSVKAYNYDNLSSSFEITEKTEKQTQSYKLDPNLTIVGIISNKKTDEPIIANIEIYDNVSNIKIATTKSNADGSFSIKLKDVTSLSISASAENYLFYSENIMFDSLNFEITQNIKLSPVEMGAKVVLNNVNFDIGKYDLRPEAIPEIDRLINIMLQYQKIKVEISGHTDNSGNAKLNKKLSKNRAQAVVNYMVSKGIAANRIKAVGYGSEKPRATNDTEEGKQLNRRVEAEILSE